MKRDSVAQLVTVPDNEGGCLPRWVSASRLVGDVSLIGFLRRCNANARMYMEHGTRQAAFAGCGTVHTISASGSMRFAEIQHQLQSLSASIVFDSKNTPSDAMPRWFGGFSFRSGHKPEGVWASFPAAQFVLPRRQLARVAGQVWLTIVEPLRPNESVADARTRLRTTLDREALRGFAGLTSQGRLVPDAPAEDLMDQDTWHQLVNATIQRIHRGELEKVVLAQACRMQLQADVDPLDALEKLKAEYNNCYRFLFEPKRGHAFFGATPELMARVNGKLVETVAMAGSSRRGKTPIEDEALGQALVKNPKERHEHRLVVDAIRRHLKPLTDNLAFSAEPGIERFTNIQHLSTDIRGALKGNRGILSVVEALHPTPAMGGTPRAVALKLIETEEPFARGWYASPVGWVDIQGNGLFAVAIRSAVSVGPHAQMFAGAGIVKDSDPQKEWDEVRLKFKPMLSALQ